MVKLSQANTYADVYVPWYVKSALGRVYNTHSSSKTSLSGIDVTMWLQHLILVPLLCSDSHIVGVYWQTVYMALYVAVVLYCK